MQTRPLKDHIGSRRTVKCIAGVKIPKAVDPSD